MFCGWTLHKLWFLYYQKRHNSTRACVHSLWTVPGLLVALSRCRLRSGCVEDLWDLLCVRPERGFCVCHREHPAALRRVGVQHLQQKIVQQHHVFSLHARQMLDSFVAIWTTREENSRSLSAWSRRAKWQMRGKFLWDYDSLLRYLRCRICESSISRCASRMDCCWDDRPVLEMLQTRASVTESSSLRTFPRLSTPSGVCDKLEQLSVN